MANDRNLIQIGATQKSKGGANAIVTKIDVIYYNNYSIFQNTCSIQCKFVSSNQKQDPLKIQIG